MGIKVLVEKTKLITFIVGMIVNLVWVTGLLAAPNVTSTTGVFASGQSITINGSGFGATGPNIIYFDDFENGTNGSTIAVGSNTAEIGGYSEARAGATYSNTYKFGGNLSLSSDASLSTVQKATIPIPANTKEVFYSYNNYSPAGMPFPGEGTTSGINWKMDWLLGVLGDNGTTTSPNGVMVMLADGVKHSANDPDLSAAPSINQYSGMSYVKGEWNFISVWWKLGTSSNGGLYITTKNSKTQTARLTNNSNITSSASTNDISYLNIPGFTRQTPNCKVYYDDIYLATGPNARARIEIGDASTYASCTKIAIATAVSWSDTKVTATLRQGSFKSGDTAYVYLIDASGNVSAGKQITFGSSSSGGTTSLTAPTNLKVVLQ